MGQYFKAILRRNNINEAYTYLGGFKLTEHSYIGCPFMASIASLLKTPANVCWVGDYANNEDLPNKEERENVESFLYDNLKNKHDIAITAAGIDNIDERILNNEYIIYNSTKKQYVNIKEYINKLPSSHSSYTLYHPLSLLTAIGNQRGSGDYFGKNSSWVGLWSGDFLETKTLDSLDETDRRVLDESEDITKFIEFLDD